ncbi:hypothetical protein H4Q26_001571 [Puccinia striiformis f. sp. tritici PST-130]|nr:hypothetical protein H4Q26_001571 [Puccinia striiformis f. sp. tritici PST-130]
MRLSMVAASARTFSEFGEHMACVTSKPTISNERQPLDLFSVKEIRPIVNANWECGSPKALISYLTPRASRSTAVEMNYKNGTRQLNSALAWVIIASASPQQHHRNRCCRSIHVR